MCYNIYWTLLHSRPRDGQQLRQLMQLLGGHVPERSLMHRGNWFVELSKQIESLLRDHRQNLTAICRLPLSRDEPGFFQAIEKPSDVGNLSDHSIPYLIATQSGRPSATKDAKDVVGSGTIDLSAGPATIQASRSEPGALLAEILSMDKTKLLPLAVGGAVISPEKIGAASEAWPVLLPEVKLEADKVHVFREGIKDLGPVRFVRLNIIPDGGVSRLRLIGTVAR